MTRDSFLISLQYRLYGNNKDSASGVNQEVALISRTRPFRVAGRMHSNHMDIELKVQVAEPVYQQIRKHLEQISGVAA